MPVTKSAIERAWRDDMRLVRKLLAPRGELSTHLLILRRRDGQALAVPVANDTNAALEAAIAKARAIALAYDVVAVGFFAEFAWSVTAFLGEPVHGDGPRDCVMVCMHGRTEDGEEVRLAARSPVSRGNGGEAQLGEFIPFTFEAEKSCFWFGILPGQRPTEKIMAAARVALRACTGFEWPGSEEYEETTDDLSPWRSLN